MCVYALQSSEMATPCTCLLQNCSRIQNQKVVIISSHTVAFFDRGYSNVKIDPHTKSNVCQHLCRSSNAHGIVESTSQSECILITKSVYFVYEHFLKCCASHTGFGMHSLFLSVPLYMQGIPIKFIVKLWNVLIIQLRLFVHFIALGHHFGWQKYFAPHKQTWRFCIRNQWHRSACIICIPNACILGLLHKLSRMHTQWDNVFLIKQEKLVFCTSLVVDAITVQKDCQRCEQKHLITKHFACGEWDCHGAPVVAAFVCVSWPIFHSLRIQNSNAGHI